MTIPVIVPLEVIVDDSRAQRKYARLRNRFSNFQPVLEGPVHQLVRRAIQDQYRTRGAYGGNPWAALARATIEKKTRAGVVGKGPLKFTEALFDSLVHPGGDSIRVDATGYHLTSRAVSEDGFPYGASHQTGTEDGHVPERQIFPDPPPASFMRDLRRLIRGYVIAVEFEGEGEFAPTFNG